MPAPQRIRDECRPWSAASSPSWRRGARPSGDLRVSNAERQAVIDELTQHTADGRLTLDEFEERVGEAYAAEVGDDLGHVLRQLPATYPAPPRHPHARDPEAHRRARSIRRGALAVVLVVVAIVNSWYLLLVPAVWMASHAFSPGHRHRRRHHHVEPASWA